MLLVASLVMGVTASNPRPAAALATTWSETATLGDGVSGLDVARQTTIEAEVWAIESVGPYMLVGGAFLNVRDRSSYQTIPRPYLAAFDPTTGEYIPWFTTQPDGPVYDIVDLGDGRALLAGEFSAVNGVPATEGIAIIDVATGNVDTSFAVSLNGPTKPVVRAVAIHDQWLYLTGVFTWASAGGTSGSLGSVARINMNTGALDAGWSPRLEGGGGWGIGTASTGRVFVGGYFLSVDGLPDTETLVAVDPNSGDVVTSWNNGFPHDTCAAAWRSSCGAVNGLAVLNDTVFASGAKHFWVAMDASDGTLLADRQISNDGQGLEIVNGMIAVGCHCSHSVSDEFPGVTDRYIRIIDPVSLTEVASPTVNSEGAAGGWAADAAPDGCLWVGGNFTSTEVNGVNHPAWSLLRFCPPGGAGTNPPLPRPASIDSTPPPTPTAPAIQAVRSASVTLAWSTVSDDSGQQIYAVYRNGELVGRTGATRFDDRLLPYDTDYYWQIAALDMSGNVSEMSARSAPVAIGPRINLAPSSTVTQVSDFSADTGAEKAVDGNVNGDPAGLSVSRTGSLPTGNTGWFGMDLGSAQHVDRIELHPRTDASFAESNNRPQIFQSTTPISAVTRAEAGNANLRVWTGDLAGSSPRVMTAELSNDIRYLRMFRGSRISFAELRVYSSAPQPTPAPQPADTANPSSPTWLMTTNSGEVTVLRWGGASDDVAIAAYDVYQGAELVWSTPERSAPVGPAGMPASAFTVIARDGAGNQSSATPEVYQPVNTCTATRTGTAVDVTWTGAAPASHYVVRRSVNGGSFFWRGLASDEDVQWVDTDRSGELIYSVQARYGTKWAAVTTCTTEVGETEPPVPQITRTEKAKIVMRWNSNGDQVEIERNGEIVATDSDGWFTDSGLDEGTEYRYRLRFTGGDVWSEEAVTTTLASPTLEPPVSCTWSDDGPTFDVSWTLGDDATSAVVERQINGGTWWWRARVDAPTMSLSDTARTGEVSYRVRAKYQDGTSEPLVCSL